MDSQHFAFSAVLYLFLIYTSVVNASSSQSLKGFANANENNLVAIADQVDYENTMPIVGILAQEVSHFVLRKYPHEGYSSYIAASYVKFVEGAGARVVPIWIGKSRDYYKNILSQINGVLLPGGATYFNQSNGYADAGRHIYEIAIEMNNNGVYFPIWGTCLGFELLVYLSANSTEPRTYCSSSAQALPLEFKENFRKSRLFRNAGESVIDILKNYAVTANFHLYCFTEETFETLKLNDLWNVLSLNHDWNGIEFISTIEHKKYPFYGSQFHPEKNIYEFIRNRNISHSFRAIHASQYFANFLVNETRRNRQHFRNQSEEVQTLIYNFSPVYTGLKGSSFVQQYLFKSEGSGANNLMTFSNVFNIFLSFFGGWIILKFYL